MGETLNNNADWDCLKTLMLLEILKTQNRLQVEFVHVWKSHVCIHKLDVQETNFSFTQIDGMWNYFSWCKFTHGRNSRPGSLGFDYWSVAFFFQPTCETQWKNAKKIVAWHTIKKTHQLPNDDPNSVQWSWIMQRRLSFFKREIFSLWCDAVHFWRWWSGDQDGHQKQKSNNETRIPKPESCAWLIICQKQLGHKNHNPI